MRGAVNSPAKLALGLSLVLASSASVGAASAAPGFPASLEAPALKRWLKQSTDLKDDEVVAVSRTSLSAISRRRSDVSGSVYALVRSEALDPAVFAQEGAASWAVEVEVDCDAREVRAGATQGYSLHNLQGAGTTLRPADAGWRRPTAGTQLDNVVRAVCEPAFKGPLVAASRDRPLTAAAAPRADPSAAPPPTRPQAASHAQAQVLASSSRETAERARSAVAAQRADLDVRVVPAQVSGATVYRVLAGGFVDDREAAAFCRNARAQGGQCFLRKGP